MTLLRRPSSSIPRDYRVDCAKMMRLLGGLGYEANAQDLYEAWSEYSESFAAGWLHVPDDAEELLKKILPYLEEY